MVRLIGCEDAKRERKEWNGTGTEIEKMGKYIFAPITLCEWSLTVVTILNFWIRKSEYDRCGFSSTLFRLSLVVVVDYTKWHFEYWAQLRFYTAEKIAKVNWSLQKFYSIICTHTSMASAFCWNNTDSKKKYMQIES